jgi:hypothetical protein
MAQILFRLKNNTHPDPEKDRRGSYKKGYPVSIKPDGWYEGNPNWAQSAYADKTKWVVVDCPEITVEECQAYVREWGDRFDYEVVSSNPANGQYVVRVFETNISTSGANAITQEKVESFLTKWGCSDISTTTNSVQFTFALWSAVRSDAFWDTQSIILKGSFVLNSYTEATGIGNITFTVIPASFVGMDEAKIATMISRKITDRGGTVTDVTYPAFTFEIERADILTRFRADVKQKAQRTYKRRQYYITTAQADAIATAGGIITRTKAQVLAVIQNGLED